jgi:predicted PurR-regulated permease PerM
MPLDLARLILAIIAILGLMLASLWIVSPFFTAIIWATMIVVSCWPLMLRLQALLQGRRALAVTVMTLLMLAVFIVPVLLAVNTIVDNVDTLLRWAKMASSFEVPPAPAWVAQIPLVGTRLSELWNGLHEAGLSSLVQRAAPYAGKGAQLVAAQAGNLGMLIIHFLLTVLIAAVMFAQGEEGAQRVLALADRVGGERGEAAVRLAAAAIRGVAISVVGTALIQTVLAGIGLAVAGVPFVGLLTAAALILCIAQAGPGPGPDSGGGLAVLERRDRLGHLPAGVERDGDDGRQLRATGAGALRCRSAAVADLCWRDRRHADHGPGGPVRRTGGARGDLAAVRGLGGAVRADGCRCCGVRPRGSRCRRRHQRAGGGVRRAGRHRGCRRTGTRRAGLRAAPTA